MTDEELADVAARAKEFDDKSKRYAERAKKLKARVLTEMISRGTRGIITNGLKITFVQAETVGYDEKKLRRSLGDDTYESLTQRVFSKDLLAAAVQEGRVPLAKVQRAATVTKNAPYVLITPGGNDE